MEPEVAKPIGQLPGPFSLSRRDPKNQQSSSTQK